MRSPLVILCCAFAIASMAARAQAPRSARRTTAEALKLKGLELVKHADIDIDGDGKKELFCVGKDKEGLRLVVVGEEPAGAVVTQLLPYARGKDIAGFMGKQLIPPTSSQQVILELYDDNPDEKVKRVRIYGMKDGVVKEIFTNVLRRSKNAADRPAWETDASIVQYGDARGGWFFQDNEEDGISEIYVRRKPQIIEIDGKDDEKVKLLTGVREQVWRWDDGLFAYAERGEELNNFLPALEISKVTASSAWIPPEELKALKAQALSDALMKKAGSEGAAGGEFDFGLDDLDAPPAKKPAPRATPKPAKPKAEKGEKAAKPEPEPEVEIDRSPYMRLGADKNLATAWIEDAPGNGKGEWLEVELEEEAPIHMVRVVAGCVDTRQTFSAHNVPETFKIQLDSGSEALVNRREPTTFERPVIAFSDQIVKLPNRPWAKTTLIFFDGKREAKRVKLTLDKAIKQGKGDNTCISEVSVH